MICLGSFPQACSNDSLFLLPLQHMISSGDYALKAETGEDLPTVQVTAGLSTNDTASGKACNNYQRPAGQVWIVWLSLGCCFRDLFEITVPTSPDCRTLATS
jgi:hypothetical protein